MWGRRRHVQRDPAGDEHDDVDVDVGRPDDHQPRFYEVQSGDTLIEIADAYGLPIQAIMEANGIVDPNMIQAGQILELPLASAIVATSLPPMTTAPGVTAAFPATTTIAP